MKSRVKNAFFFVPSMCSFAGAITLFFGVNNTNLLTSVILLTITEVFVWSYVGPIVTVTQSCVPAKVSSIAIFIYFILSIFFYVPQIFPKL